MADSAATLSEALHRLLGVARLADAPPELLQQTATQLHEIAEQLAPYQSNGIPCAAMLDGNLASYPKNAASPQEVMPYSPLIGTRNGVSPRFVLRYVGERVEGEGIFPPLFTGPPDTAHGGMVAALFDELLTAVVLRNGPAAFTASLTVQYRQRIRIGEQVTLSAEITQREGRKIFTRGELFQQGVLAATAEALFIEPRQAGEEKP